MRALLVLSLEAPSHVNEILQAETWRDRYILGSTDIAE